MSYTHYKRSIFTIMTLFPLSSLCANPLVIPRLGKWTWVSSSSLKTRNVRIEHMALFNLLAWLLDRFRLGQKQKCVIWWMLTLTNVRMLCSFRHGRQADLSLTDVQMKHTHICFCALALSCFHVRLRRWIDEEQGIIMAIGGRADEVAET